MGVKAAQPTDRSRADEPDRYLVADASDDALSLGAKLAEVRSQRVVLVIPNENYSLDDPISLRILVRAASRESIALALVSGRRHLRRLAEREGLITFASLSGVPRERSDVSAPPGPTRAAVADLWSGLASGVSWAAALILVLAILVLAALTIPRAVVNVRPVTNQLSGTVKITASADTPAPDPTKGLLPSRTVYLLVNSSASLPINGKTHPLDGRAVTFVTFENRVNHPVTVPKGTDLQTLSKIGFSTTKAVTLAGHAGATAQVPVIADYPGESGNVQGDKIVVVNDKNLRWEVTVVNEQPAGGGGPEGQPIISPWDTQTLLDQVSAEARKTAQTRLAGVVTNGEIALPESVEVTPIQETFDHPVGATANELTVQVQSRVQADIINQQALDDLAMQMWHPGIRPGFTAVSGSVKVGTPVVEKITASAVTLDVPLHAVAAADLNTQRIAAYVRLQSPARAEQALNKLFDFATPARVSIVPDWLPRAYRVQVVVNTNPAPGPTPAPAHSSGQ